MNNLSVVRCASQNFFSCLSRFLYILDMWHLSYHYRFLDFVVVPKCEAVDAGESPNMEVLDVDVIVGVPVPKLNGLDVEAVIPLNKFVVGVLNPMLNGLEVSVVAVADKPDADVVVVDVSTPKVNRVEF